MNSFFGKIFVPALLFNLFLISCSHSQPKIFFVGTNGSDSNAGDTAEKPLQSINTAIRKAAPGDTVFVLPGTYSEVIDFYSVNGQPENPVCLSGLPGSTKEYPVIDGRADRPSMALENDWMHFKISSWIEIRNLKFINGWTFPIKVENSSYLSFSGCVFYGGKRVVSAGGSGTHHILIENCYWDQGGDFLWEVKEDKSGVDAWTSMHHEDMQYFNGSIIDFSGTGGSMVIRGNTIINAFNALRWRGQQGFDTNVEIYDNKISRVRDNDFEPEYYTYNLHVYHNKSHNVHRTMSVDNCNGGMIFYYGNVVTMDADDWTKQVCTGFWKIYGGERNLEFPLYGFNNSFYGSGHALRAEQDVRNFRHFNNAYYFTGDTCWMLDKWNPTDEYDYDISNIQWPAVFTENAQEKNGKIADVMFADPAARNLKLLNGSPAVDAGRIMQFENFGWTQTFEGIAPDMGAYENGKLAEGPPFRFMLPQGVTVTYKEKPRIVRYAADGKRLTLYVSFPLDSGTVIPEAFELYSGGKPVKINSAVVSSDKYSVVIETEDEITPGNLSLGFKKFPEGINGEKLTSWASALKIHRITNR